MGEGLGLEAHFLPIGLFQPTPGLASIALITNRNLPITHKGNKHAAETSSEQGSKPQDVGLGQLAAANSPWDNSMQDNSTQ